MAKIKRPPKGSPTAWLVEIIKEHTYSLAIAPTDKDLNSVVKTFAYLLDVLSRADKKEKEAAEFEQLKKTVSNLLQARNRDTVK